jgi:hypothetical protein
LGGGGGEECRASKLTLAFGTIRTTQLSTVRVGRTLPGTKLHGALFCQGFSGHQGFGLLTKGLGHLNISKYPTGCRTSNQEGISDPQSCYYTKLTKYNCHLGHF